MRGARVRLNIKEAVGENSMYPPEYSHIEHVELRVLLYFNQTGVGDERRSNTFLKFFLYCVFVSNLNECE